ncbi:GNAT family N-acetyltransferase [Saccharothrix sp. NPDC042600]|uniref:GNAT family N-acetyltransferase n=1 Tax=Saccharothrix TaxID=2071 RepID=UPI00341102B4
MEIRRARAEDADRLTALMHASSAYQGNYASILDGYRVTREYVERNVVHLAAGPRDELLGFYALVLDPPELDIAFVADDAQGRGVGRALVDHMRAQAREAGLDRVRVVSHPPAERFYLSVGAERVGVVPASPPKVTWERPELVFTIA